MSESHDIQMLKNDCEKNSADQRDTFFTVCTHAKEEIDRERSKDAALTRDGNKLRIQSNNPAISSNLGFHKNSI